MSILLQNLEIITEKKLRTLKESATFLHFQSFCDERRETLRPDDFDERSEGQHPYDDFRFVLRVV